MVQPQLSMVYMIKLEQRRISDFGVQCPLHINALYTMTTHTDSLYTISTTDQYLLYNDHCTPLVSIEYPPHIKN